MEREKLIALLKSGNFSVASHDYGQVSIYEGRYDGYDSLSDEKEVGDFSLSDSDGYMQDVISLLTEALGGSVAGSA